MKRKKYTQLITVCFDLPTIVMVKDDAEIKGISVSEWFRIAAREKLDSFVKNKR